MTDTRSNATLREALTVLRAEIEKIPPKGNDWKLLKAYDAVLNALPSEIQGPKHEGIDSSCGPEASRMAEMAYDYPATRKALDEALARIEELETSAPADQYKRALETIRDECFNGAAYDIAVAALKTPAAQVAETVQPESLAAGPAAAGPAPVSAEETCPRCYGDGPHAECSLCHGSGYVTQPQLSPSAIQQIAPNALCLDEHKHGDRYHYNMDGAMVCVKCLSIAAWSSNLEDAQRSAMGVTLNDLDWERLRSGQYRALNPDNQPLFDEFVGRKAASISSAIGPLESRAAAFWLYRRLRNRSWPTAEPEWKMIEEWVAQVVRASSDRTGADHG